MNHEQHSAATHLTAPQDQHLTEDQFSDYVLGLSTEAMDTHIEQCQPCRAEVLRVQEVVGMFAEAGREWSTLQPASLPVAEAARSIRRRSLWMSLRPVAGFAAAAAVVFAVTISTHRAPSGPAHVALNSVPLVPALSQPAAGRAPASEKAQPRTLAIPASSGVATDTATTLSGVIAPASETAAPLISREAAARERQTSADEVAQDNALMAAIDAEIASPYTVADVGRPFHGQ